MRVVCIEDSYQFDETMPKVKKGNVYTVIGQRLVPKDILTEYRHIAGVYYLLVECGMEVAYHSSSFVEINEDQQDETEIHQQLKQQSL